MKMKRKIKTATVTGIVLAVLFIGLFRSSWTEDRYVCHLCKSFGQSTAFRGFHLSGRLSTEENTSKEKEALNTVVSAERIARIRTSESRGVVTSLCFSPNSMTLASGVVTKMPNRMWDHSIHLWDLATASEIRKLEGHKDNIQSLAFSPDGETLASASHDRTIQLWNVKTGKQIRKFGLEEGAEPSWVGFSTDGKTVGGGWSDLRRRGKPTIYLWDVATAQQRNKIEADNAVFLPDGQMLACRLTYASVRVWEVHTHRDIMTYVGTGIDTNGGMGDYRHHSDSPKREPNWASPHCQVFGVFSADGNSLATVGLDLSHLGSANILRVWDVGTGQERFKVQGHQSDVSPIAFSPDSETLACGTYGKGVVLRETTTGKKLLTLPSPDGNGLEVGEGRGGASPKEEYAACLTFSPDGNCLAAGYRFGTILIWRLSRQRTTGIAEQPAPADGAYAAAGP